MSADLILNLISEVLDSNLKLDKKVIKEEQDSMTLTYNAIPEIPLSEIGWSSIETREGGKEVPSEQRQQLINFLKRIEGNDIAEKMQELSKFFIGDEEYLRQKGFIGEGGGASAAADIISYLTFYKTLTTIITHFNAASAGFSFESFLAVLLNGKQIPTGQQTIADLIARGSDGKETPISLKLYTDGSLKVGGSFTDLANDLIKDGKMQYVCVTKRLSGKGLEQEGELDFYRFNFNLDNVFNIVSRGVGKHKACVLLPQPFMDSNGQDSEGVPGKKATLPTPEELETEYADIVKKAIADKAEAIQQEIGPITEKMIDDIIIKINYSDLDNFTNTKTPSQSNFNANRLANNILGFISGREFNDKKINGPTAVSKTLLYQVFRDANNVTLRSRYKSGELDKLRQTQINNLYFPGEMSFEERIENSRKFYEAASPELKKKCLKVAKGYVDVMQFELNQNHVINIDKLAEPTPGELFPPGQTKSKIDNATIKIGVKNVKEMLSRVTGELNKIIFGIFTSLKSLTQQLQSYFAGGLQDDQQAEDAKKSALSIEQRTAETQAQAKAERAADTAKQQSFNKTRRQAQATSPRAKSGSTYGESKEFDDQLQLLMKEVFGR